MNDKTRIVAVVVDTARATFYKPDGTTIVIEQGDERLRRILDEAIPQLKANALPNGTSWADIWIDKPGDNDWAKFEEKSNGLVKFFRIAKQKLKELVGMDKEPVEPTYVGQVPASPVEQVTNAVITPQVPADTQKALNVVDEIMKHAVPVSSAAFNEKSVDKQRDIIDPTGQTNGREDADAYKAPDTIIAVVDGKVVPGMEKIKSQFARAHKLGSSVGVENFLKRLGAIIDQRGHSVEDLLKFMERGDLPIADDGSIVIYKVLRKTYKDHKALEHYQDATYVDCHSQNVPQWVGAFVHMDPKLVDHNRRNECSNGLHVARRGYIHGFGGDVCVLAKLAPEDVIAVPEYDSNKMRVCGYHIIAELTAEQYSNLKSNRPITGTEAGKKLLAKALTGDHIGRTHEVQITGQRGSGIKVKALTAETNVVEAAIEAMQPADPAVQTPVMEELENQIKPVLQKAEAMPDKAQSVDVPKIDPRAVIEEVKAAPSRKDIAHGLHVEWVNAKPAHKDAALAALIAFKKQSKTSWEKLGIPDPTGKTKPVVKARPVRTVKGEPLKASAKPSPNKGKKVPAKVPVSNSKAVDLITNKIGSSPRERIHQLLALGHMNADIAQRIVKIKQQSRKAWHALGVDMAQEASIMQHIKKDK
jgi:hypothetical protein